MGQIRDTLINDGSIIDFETYMPYSYNNPTWYKIVRGGLFIWKKHVAHAEEIVIESTNGRKYITDYETFMEETKQFNLAVSFSTRWKRVVEDGLFI